MGLFDDLFHRNKQRRNAEGREQNERFNRNAPDPYGGGYGRPEPNKMDRGYWNGNPFPQERNGGRDWSQFDQSKYDADMAAYEGSYSQNQVTFDETGRPMVNGQPINRPGADFALDYQYLVEGEAERRRNSLWQDAQNSMRQGLDLYQSYRPGGSAAMASGMFQQSASMYGTQALNTVAPDMMSEYRNRELQDSKRERERSRKFSEMIAMGQMFINPGGFFSSGPTPQPGADAPPGVVPDPTNPPPGVVPPGSTVAPGAAAGSSVGAASGGIGPMGGGGIGPAGAGGGAYGAQVGPDGQPMSSNIRRAGGGGVSADGGFGAGGSAGGPVGAGGGGGRRMGGGQGSGMGGGMGGGPPIQTYTGGEVATRAQAMAPGASEAATASWTGSAVRSESVVLRVAAARSQLVEAVGAAGNPSMGLLSLLI